MDRLLSVKIYAMHMYTLLKYQTWFLRSLNGKIPPYSLSFFCFEIYVQHVLRLCNIEALCTYICGEDLNYDMLLARLMVSIYRDYDQF